MNNSTKNKCKFRLRKNNSHKHRNTVIFRTNLTDSYKLYQLWTLHNFPYFYKIYIVSMFNLRRYANIYENDFERV